MNTRKISILVLLPVIAAWLGGLSSAGPATQVAYQSPVWGSKPVLSYFALTTSLSEAMRSELRLSEVQFTAIRQAARQEAQRLREIELSSLDIIRDDELSLAEKRARIALSGYNQRVTVVLADTQAQLEEGLGVADTARLVEWIESRWLVEQELHGLASLDQTSASRTYSIYATRFDTDSYIVALPDQCLKRANAGSHVCDDSGYSTGENYSVRLTYQDSVTAKVGESGPWNVDDNYWSGVGDPQPRRLFPDLEAGMPEAQAAYFDDYNNGEDQFGRTVTAPYGIDLADQVSIDIGLNPGNNDWIDVTFLWTDGWDDIQSEYVLLTDPSDLTPAYTGDMCVTAWHRITGYGDHAYLTLNVSEANQSTNSAEWQADLPASGEYQVLAFVPDHPPIDWLCPAKEIPRDTASARYTVYYDGGQKSVTRDQGPLANMWLDLGTYEFSSDGMVALSDVTGEEDLSHTVAFSAILFRSLDYPEPTPEPTPTATPTPTPTPAPFLWAGSGIAPPSTTITIPVGASYLQIPGLGTASIDVQYDPARLEAVECQPDPAGVFDSHSCELSYEKDGVSPDALRFSLGSAAGVSGNPLLAQLGFRAVGNPGEAARLDLNVQVFETPLGEPITAQAFSGMVCIAPCSNIAYLPVILRP